MTNKNSAKTNQNIITISKKSISLLIIGVAVILAFIGVFGSMIKITQTQTSDYVRNSISTEYGLKFIFSELWDNIRLLQDRGAPDNYIFYEKFIGVLHIISFLVAVLGIVIISLHCIYNIYQKNQINLKKEFSILIALAFQYPMLESIFLNASMRASSSSQITTIKSSFAWGGILIIVAFFVGLIGLIVYETEDSKELVSASNIAIKLSILTVFFICMFGLANLASITLVPSTGTREVQTYSSFDLLEAILALQGQELPNISSGITKCSFACAFHFIAFVLLIYIIYSLLNNDLNKTWKKTIGFSFGYTLLMLVSGILTNSALKTCTKGSTENNSYALGSSTIVSIVLGVLLVIFVITSINLQNKIIRFEKSKK